MQKNYLKPNFSFLFTVILILSLAISFSVLLTQVGNAQNFDNCTGSVYVDNLKLRPALNSKDDWHTAQSCRLYPEDDSLGCDYYEDSGIRQKGWLGYCLQYDRYPGSEDNCILWYPVDRVKGDGIEEGAGYIGAYPLYYSLETSISAETYSLPYPIHQDLNNTYNQCSNPIVDIIDEIKEIHYSLIPEINMEVHVCSEHSADEGCHDKTFLLRWDGSVFRGIESTCSMLGCLAANVWIEVDGSGYPTVIRGNHCDGSSSKRWSYWHWIEIRELHRSYDSKIVRTVTPIGQNKYWSGRVYEGSEFAIPCNFGISGAESVCTYNSDYYPFGRVVPPAGEIYDLANPLVWDSKSDEAGKQPLYYEEPDTSLAQPYQPRAGQLHSVETVKRLFAKSYGTWQWSESQGQYTRVDGEEWEPPENWCPNNIRPKAEVSNIETYTYDCTDVNIQICADNAHETYFNGNFVGSAADWNIVTPYSIALIPGENVIAVKAIDWGVIYGVSVKINWTCNEPVPPVDTSSFTDWKCTTNPGSGWTDINYDDSSWPTAVLTTAAGPTIGNALDVPMIWATGAGAGSTVYCRYTFNNETEVTSETEVTCNGGDCFDCPSPTCDYCGVRPVISNMKVNDQSGDYIINSNGFVKFTFNSLVDSQQLPLVMYAVDWQDGDKTVVTGVEMRDRLNADNPHVVYHLYSYWDLISKAPTSGGTINCVNDCSGYGASGACCVVQPSVKIKDNWGWCNNGVEGTPCPLGGYQSYTTGRIIVTGN